MASRNVSIDTTNYPTRSFSRTNRYTGTQYGSASTSEVSPVDNSMAPPSTKGEVSPVSPLDTTATTAPVAAAARPSFSAFDEIRLESPRELQPLGLGLTNATTSDVFRANFYKYNNMAPGTGLENLGNLSRSNSNSSSKSSNSRSSSRSSSHSMASSVSSTGLPEKPPAYVLEEGNAEKKSAWRSLSRWTPLMWLQLLFFLGVPTLTLSWIVSLLYFTLIPRLFASKGKALNEWVLAGVERDTATGVQRQEGISLDGVEYIEVRKSMRRWEVATAAAAGFVWTTLCVVFGVIAVEFTRRGVQGVSYGNGDVGGDY